jgi:outer membrane protein OmpA-like peptidoglycan-associated protein
VVEPANLATNMPIQGKVLDAKTQTPIAGAKLIFVDSYGKKDSVSTDSLGNYQHINPRIENVEVRTYAKGYFFVSKIAQKSKETLLLNFSLEPCIIGAKLALQNLYFFGGNAQLTPASEAGLEGILAFLNLNDALKIEIGGHVNKPNAPACEIGDASHKLSEARAQSVYKYLIDKGIQPQRLSFKGYANWEMIHPEANNSIQEQLNRRVELKIIP